VVEIEHHDSDGTVLPASGVKFALEELLHEAAAVEAGERVADGLHAERFTQVKVGNRDRDMFGSEAGELDAASEDVRAVVWVRNGEQYIVILDSQRPEGISIGDERNAHRRTFAKQVRTARGGASPGMSMGASAPKSPTLFG
jgi:hypothetical protein